jgi:hypothetical protein
MRRRVGGLLVSALAWAGASALPLAHHSVAGEFDASKPVTLAGVISKVDWINPHIYLHLDVKEPDGAVTSWQLETLPTAMMRRAGLSRDTIAGKPGEVVTVTGIGARDGTKHLAWISKITYADGHAVMLARE